MTVINVPMKLDEGVVRFLREQFGISDAESSANITPTNSAYPPGNVIRYGADPTGTVDSTSAFNSAVKLGGMRVPSGSYKVTGCVVSTNDCTMVGDGAENTVITVGANNSNIFQVTAQRFRISGIKLVGNSTSSSSTNGCAIYLTGAGEFVSQDCSFSSIGFAAVAGTASSSLKGPTIIRAKFRSSKAGAINVYLGGMWRDTLLEHCDGVETVANNMLVMYDNGTTGWQGVVVRGGYCEGYQQQGIVGDDENPSPSERVWSFLVDGMRFKNVNWSGVKAKNCNNTKVVNCTFDGCTIAAEDLGNGLYADVLLNSMGRVEVANNVFRNSGTEAIRVYGPSIGASQPGWADGLHRSQWDIHHNHIDGTGVTVPSVGNGITVSNGLFQCSVAFNTVRNCVYYPLNVAGVATAPLWDVGLYGNQLINNPLAAASINASFCDTLRMDGNITKNGPATGALISDCYSVIIGPTDQILDPSAAGGRGYQIGGNLLYLKFRGKAGNTVYPTWVTLTAYTVGQRVFNGANVYECSTAGTSGATGPTHTSGFATEGTVTWAFCHKYLLMPYGLRLVNTNTAVKTDIDGDFSGCTSGPFEALVVGSGGFTAKFKQQFQTTVAGPTTAYTIPLPDTFAFMFEHATVGKKTDSTDRAMYHRNALFYRNGGGTTLQGAVQELGGPVESNAAWDANQAASGNNVILSLTGVAATTINWNISTDIRGI